MPHLLATGQRGGLGHPWRSSPRCATAWWRPRLQTAVALAYLAHAAAMEEARSRRPWRRMRSSVTKKTWFPARQGRRVGSSGATDGGGVEIRLARTPWPRPWLQAAAATRARSSRGGGRRRAPRPVRCGQQARRPRWVRPASSPPAVPRPALPAISDARGGQRVEVEGRGVASFGR